MRGCPSLIRAACLLHWRLCQQPIPPALWHRSPKWPSGTVATPATKLSEGFVDRRVSQYIQKGTKLEQSVS
jgi:hypothetical protein